MTQTIRNPIEWSADQVKGGYHYIESVTEHLGGAEKDPAHHMPRIRQLTTSDIFDSLKKGVDDFKTFRTDIAFLCIIYPIVGVLLTYMAFNHSLMHLVFPAVAGFALLGPIAAVGAYEMSRRREQGLSAGWSNAIDILASPSFGAILILGMALLAIFLGWMLTAIGIFSVTMGPLAPGSFVNFVYDALTTGPGWAMILIGCGVGFLYAALVLAISVVSFPLLLDRDVGLPVAVITSLRVTSSNLRVISAWGAIIAAGLVIGSIPAFLGLVVVMPILGHASWHLYRRAVVAAPAPAGDTDSKPDPNEAPARSAA